MNDFEMRSYARKQRKDDQAIVAWQTFMVCATAGAQVLVNFLSLDSMHSKLAHHSYAFSWQGLCVQLFGTLLFGISMKFIICRRARQISEFTWAQKVIGCGNGSALSTGVLEVSDLKVMIADPTICSTIVLWACAFFLPCVIVPMFNHTGARYEILANTLKCAFLAASFLPATSIVALYLVKWLNRESRRKLGANSISSPREVSKQSLRCFFAERYPYVTAYMGFVYFCVLSAFLPNGLGAAAAGWFAECMSGAFNERVAHFSGGRYGLDGMPLDVVHWSYSPFSCSQLDMAVSAVVAVLLYLSLSGLAVRLSAGFQALTTRMIIHGDSLLEALMETTSVRTTKIFFTEAHPHLNNICRIFGWLTFCYAALFCLIAFCPAPLGTVINNWLTSCLIDARLVQGYEYGTYVRDHPDVRLFLASLVAALGAAPLAVMCCSFLPNKRFQSLILSPYGVLCPSGVGDFAARSPLKLWSDLKSVSLKNCGKQAEVVLLSFQEGGTIKLKTTQLEREKLANLLASADEHAPECNFDPQVTRLRSQLCQEVKNVSLAELNKFSSTAFNPHSSNDMLRGKYRVVRKLAGKSLSAVYLARNPEDRLVVIKQFMLPSNVELCERIDKQFNREYEILSLLKSGSIAQVLETFEQGGSKYLVMEHINGSDLRSIVENRGPRSESRVLKWAGEIVQIMMFLHSQSPPILHRDLTPDNVMQDQVGKLKVIDFGAAHQFVEGVTGTLIGKQCYIAPEQLRGTPSEQSDIYSFGCTLYFLLAGKDPVALRQCDLSADRIPVSHELSQLVNKCTAFDQHDRFESFSQVYSALESIGSHKITLESRELVEDVCRT